MRAEARGVGAEQGAGGKAKARAKVKAKSLREAGPGASALRCMAGAELVSQSFQSVRGKQTCVSSS